MNGTEIGGRQDPAKSGANTTSGTASSQDGGLTRIGSPLLGLPRRKFGDFCLFAITGVELVLLILMTPTFALADWIYLSGHILVLGIALTRSAPMMQDLSWQSGIAVIVAYTYSYAQILYLRWVPGNEVWPGGGLVLVVLGAALSFASLLNLGRGFGVWPAFRGLASGGPYRFIRHPMYLAYVLQDIGYNLYECNPGTVLMVIVGWIALFHRIRAEERILTQDAGWAGYAASVRYRLLPGLW